MSQQEYDKATGRDRRYGPALTFNQLRKLDGEEIFYAFTRDGDDAPMEGTAPLDAFPRLDDDDLDGVTLSDGGGYYIDIYRPERAPAPQPGCFQANFEGDNESHSGIVTLFRVRPEPEYVPCTACNR